MTIAAIESVSLGACMRMLSNADAVFGSGGATKRVIFKDDYAEDFGVAGRAPQLQAMPSDLPPLSRGATVTISNHASAGSYKVVTWQPDGDGYTRLLLEKA